MSHSHTNKLAWRWLLIASFAGLSWLGMQAAHEFGHVAAAWCTGGTVSHIELAPWTFSRTDLSANPAPLAVAWGGPVIGSIVPLAAMGLAWLARVGWSYLLRAFAGFCLITNGMYVGIASLQGVADGRDLLAHGAQGWQIAAFAAAATAMGLGLWHRQGRHFGLGDAGRRVSATAAIISAALLLGVVAIESLVCG